MAKIHVDRIAKRLGIPADEVTGSNYRRLMAEVLAENNANIQRAVSRKTVASLSASISTSKMKRKVILPDVSDVLPKKSVEILKAAERGNLIVDSMRKRLNQTLQETLTEWKATGEHAWEVQTGKRKGQVNLKLIQKMKSNLSETFASYGVGKKRGQIPSNIETIAITETRSAVNSIKRNYMERFSAKNPGVDVMKTWKQNRALAEEPRIGHSAVSGTTLPLTGKFKVPLYKQFKGSWRKIGVTMMDGPHDPTAPAEQVIRCNCDIVYSVREKGLHEA